MPQNPHVDDKAFFDHLDSIALTRSEAGKGYPWLDVIEDRAAAEDEIALLYRQCGLNPPKMAWAASPRSMFGAMQMLRQIHIGQRQEMIKALVPMGDPVETETKRVLLEAILDKDVTVTTGASVASLLKLQNTGMRKSLVDLKYILDVQFQTPNPRLPGWHDLTVYPAERLSGNHWLTSQTLCIVPFARMCWLCRPPLFVRTDNGDGTLCCFQGPAVRFADGYEIWAAPKHSIMLNNSLPKDLALPAPESHDAPE